MQLMCVLLVFNPCLTSVSIFLNITNLQWKSLNQNLKNLFNLPLNNHCCLYVGYTVVHTVLHSTVIFILSELKRRNMLQIKMY